MAAIEKVPAGVSAEQKKKLAALGKEVTTLLDKIGDLVGTSKSNDVFYKAYAARLATYRAMEGKALGATAKATGLATVAAGVAMTARTVVDIATALA